MTTFEYLSVLVSIIIGLAITQLLSGAARLIQVRSRVQLHLTTLCWMLILFLVDTQIWWAAFERRDNDVWNFFFFLLYLLQPILAYLMGFLVLPELGNEDQIDLSDNFASNRPYFFGLLALLPLASLVEETITSGQLPHGVDAAFRVVFLVLALVAARIRSSRFHAWNAFAILALVCGYIAILFLRLR